MPLGPGHLDAEGNLRRFEILAYQRQALLQGLDELSATLARLEVIEAFERGYRALRPWLAVPETTSG